MPDSHKAAGLEEMGRRRHETSERELTDVKREKGGGVTDAYGKTEG